MSKVIGSDLIVEVGGNAIAHSKGCTINFTSTEIDLTTKDSTYADAIPDIKSWNISGNGLVDFSSGIENVPSLFDAWKAGTKITTKFTTKTEAVGDVYFSGDAYIMNLSLAAEQGSAATYNFEFKGVGEISKTTVVTP